jgi:hypothetical protein
MTTKLTAEQIIDLIFEKEIVIDNMRISSEHSYLSILSALDRRLRDGKVTECQDPVFCWTINGKDIGTGSWANDWKKFGRRKKANGAIGNSI